ncbi:TMEM175 family protein [Pedobacter boryungensis]|uniref:DUF1211 domain-containing protein n=1 Tax=Pedobacter boryungensis TaxID=869962 RepID=A0ABX2D7X4_9SPHI|nr:TMEM175 family protein [Pedobacter boryungensis]NQX30153.1 DUF1211 domain-containing protein [Pedobacter boryungensis]
MKNEDQEITKQEIKKEFQLERMILFSDAVFAIVITLMAIEIHIPKLPDGVHYTQISFIDALKHVYPTIFGYLLSFFFIGAMWYKHLQMFSLLKDYDKGLIVRNLIFLCFIGLFPFGASLITLHLSFLLPAFLYFIIIILCMGAQLFLHDYILNRSKNIIINVNHTDQKLDLKKRIYLLTLMVVIVSLGYITYTFFLEKEDKSLAMLWAIVFIPISIFINKRLKL